MIVSRTPSEPTAHAETQTQIRGITVQSALWQNSRTASTDSAVSDISVATISRLLEQMEGGGEGGGLVTVPAVIFFTESDNTNNRNKRLVSSSCPCPLSDRKYCRSVSTSQRSALAEPVLICDLPGQNNTETNTGEDTG